MPKGIPNNGINRGWFSKEPRPEKRTGVVKVCECGASFWCQKGLIKRKKYCSKKCQNDYRTPRGPHTEESKNKIRVALSGKPKSKEHKLKMRLFRLGKKFSLERRKNHSLAQLRRWDIAGRKDVSELQRYGDDNKDRRSSAYNAWRKRVWQRDNFKCKIANSDCKGRLETHHILSWREHPELRYEINNGITLCHFHHPLKRVDEKKLSPYFQQLVASTETF